MLKLYRIYKKKKNLILFENIIPIYIALINIIECSNLIR